MNEASELARDKRTENVPEDKAELEQAKDNSSLEDYLLKACSLDELNFELRRLKALEKLDAYKRKRCIADYESDLKGREAKCFAWLKLIMAVGGVVVACLCFLAAILIKIKCWLLPLWRPLPAEAVPMINYIITFGFGVITTQINKLFKNN